MTDPTRTAANTQAWDDAGADQAPALLIVHHPQAAVVGRRIRLGTGSLSLGRGGDALGPGGLDDERLSRAHATLRYRQGMLHLKDPGSSNGTFLNGRRVREAVVRDGDVLGIGQILIVARWLPAAWSMPEAYGMVGESEALASALRGVAQAGPLQSPVLILGETGTGKERMARAVHARSGARGEFVAVNCGALDDQLLRSELFGHVKGAFSGAHADRRGLIEEADGGTLFLDEIGEADPKLQTSLLRVIQEGEVRRVGGNRTIRVSTRFVAATHRDLEAGVASGDFREDLYARLARWIIRVPPLRERREDVLLLAAHLARSVTRRPLRLHREVASRLLLHDWPRNVRELEAAIEQIAVIGRGQDVIRMNAAIDRLAPRPPEPEAAPAAGPRPRPSDADLRALLAKHGGNLKACALELGVARNTVYRWVRLANIDLDALRREG